MRNALKLTFKEATGHMPHQWNRSQWPGAVQQETLRRESWEQPGNVCHVPSQLRDRKQGDIQQSYLGGLKELRVHK